MCETGLDFAANDSQPRVITRNSNSISMFASGNVVVPEASCANDGSAVLRSDSSRREPVFFWSIINKYVKSVSVCMYVRNEDQDR